MKITIGRDKSGFAVKEAVKAYLTEAGIECDDLGTTDLIAAHPYYRVASEVAPLVQKVSALEDDIYGEPEAGRPA